jgi:hypothetical protein
MAGVAGAMNELRPVTQPGTSRMRRTRQLARDIVIAFTLHPRRSRPLMAHPPQGHNCAAGEIDEPAVERDFRRAGKDGRASPGHDTQAFD